MELGANEFAMNMGSSYSLNVRQWVFSEVHILDGPGLTARGPRRRASRQLPRNTPLWMEDFFEVLAPLDRCYATFFRDRYEKI